MRFTCSPRRADARCISYSTTSPIRHAFCRSSTGTYPATLGLVLALAVSITGAVGYLGELSTDAGVKSIGIIEE